MRVKLGDLCLNVECAGRGEPLLLLHGFTGSARTWGSVLPALGEGFRTVAVDLIGHGASDSPAEAARYVMERCTEDLACLLDRLAIERAHVLGYSMGARVALAFALARGERVRRLVLESGSPGLQDPAERAARAAHDRALAAGIERDGVPLFVDAWMAQPFFATQRRLPATLLDEARRQRLACSAVGLANSLRGMGTGAQPPLWNRLDGLAVPTLLVAGDEDSKFRILARRMAERLPDARVTVIAGAGHNTHLEQPAAFTAAVLEFLTAPHESNELADADVVERRGVPASVSTNPQAYEPRSTGLPLTAGGFQPPGAMIDGAQPVTEDPEEEWK